MRNLTKALLNELLEDITDYDGLNLSQQAKQFILDKCEETEDIEFVEKQVNLYLKNNGYEYNCYTWTWGKV